MRGMWSVQASGCGLQRSPHRPSLAAPGGVGQRCEPAGRADGRRGWRGRAGLMTSMGRGTPYGTYHWSDGAWRVIAQGSIGAPAGASARAGRGCTAYALHAQPCIVGLHEQASRGCHDRRRICEVVQSSE